MSSKRKGSTSSSSSSSSSAELEELAELAGLVEERVEKFAGLAELVEERVEERVEELEELGRVVGGYLTHGGRPPVERALELLGVRRPRG